MSNPIHAVPAPNSWRGKKKSISWNAAAPADLKIAIAAVTESQGAIMFSRTQDGGALICSVYAGTERAKEYVTEESDIPTLLQWVASTYS